MRTAHLIGVFPKLSETFILNQLTGLIDRGHEVDIFDMALGDLDVVHPDVVRYDLLAHSRYIRVPEDHVKRVLKVGSQLVQPYAWHLATLDAFNVRKYGRRALNLERLYATLSFLKQKRYDIVHCHFGGLGLVGLELLQQGVITGKLVTSIRGADITSTLQAQPGLYDDLLQEGHLFLPISEFFKHKLIDEGCDPKKIAVLRDGIDLRRFAFKERTRVAGEPTRLLFIGRFEAKKGVFMAAQAVAEVIRSGRNLLLDIVGDGALRPELEAFIRAQGVSDRVRLHGWQSQDQVLEHLQNAHLLIAPSVTAPSGDQEGIPNTVKEGMAVGLPVLSTFHSGIPELVEDGVSGYLVPEHDTSALAERLTYLADHPECWAALGRAGRAKIEADYNIETLNDKLASLYEGLLSPSPQLRQEGFAALT